MADSVKVLILERNGVELSQQEELDLVLANIPFTASGFSATDAQEGIVEAGKFGMSAGFVAQTAETSTTSTTVWSTKLTLNLSSLVSGVYLINFSCVQRTAAANRETDIRIRDGSTTLWETRTSIVRTQGVCPIAGFVIQSGVSGSKTYTLEFKVGATATTSFVRDAYLAVWRFS